MQASIQGEGDDGCGLEVIDNNEIEHWIEIKYGTSEISYHEQDGYADDPNKRTSVENEHVRQARNYARYYVYQKKDYDTFSVEKNYPGAERAKTAIEALPQSEFAERFADLYKQVKGNGPDVDRPVPYPPSVDTHDPVVILMDLYVDADGELEAVSDIHLQYQDENASEAFVWNDDPYPDRKPDARIQMMPSFSPSLEAFKKQVVYHLRCQLRDCYIGAGVEPPEPYRVLGFGQYKIDQRYRNPEITIYEEYSEPHADVAGYTFEFDYGFGELGRSVIILNSLRKTDPVIRELINRWEQAERGPEKIALSQQLAALTEERGYTCPEILETLSEEDPDLESAMDDWFDEETSATADMAEAFAEIFTLTPDVEAELSQYYSS